MAASLMGARVTLMTAICTSWRKEGSKRWTKGSTGGEALLKANKIIIAATACYCSSLGSLPWFQLCLRFVVVIVVVVIAVVADFSVVRFAHGRSGRDSNRLLSHLVAPVRRQKSKPKMEWSKGKDDDERESVSPATGCCCCTQFHGTVRKRNEKALGAKKKIIYFYCLHLVFQPCLSKILYMHTW